MKYKLTVLSAAAAIATLVSGAASATTHVVVPGTSNPFLAGMSSGTTCCDADTAPQESPVYAAEVVAGATITISNVQGWVENFPASSGDNANGDATNAQTVGSFNGISGFSNAPINALVGVFLGSSISPTAPASLDLSGGPISDPALQQIFLIGAGPDSFVAPTGATSLYLGTIDGYQWNNNSGAFSLDLSGGVPEPSTWAMMLVGFGGLGAAMRSRRKQAAATA
jgi:hypothetical protein